MFFGCRTAPDPLGDKGGDPDWYGYCLDDPVNGNDPLGLEADCVSGDFNAAGFGFRGEAGLGVCWDDSGDVRGMGHADIGASSGWGVGGTGTWQSTDATSVEDLAGSSKAMGGGIAIPIAGPLAVTGGMDKIFADKYRGEAYSAGIGVGKPTVPEAHAMQQNTWLWGAEKK